MFVFEFVHPVNLLSWKQSLLFEAEALDLVEVQTRLGRVHVVGGDARNGLRRRVLDGVKRQRRLAWNQL